MSHTTILLKLVPHSRTPAAWCRRHLQRCPLLPAATEGSSPVPLAIQTTPQTHAHTPAIQNFTIVNRLPHRSCPPITRNPARSARRQLSKRLAQARPGGGLRGAHSWASMQRRVRGHPLHAALRQHTPAQQPPGTKGAARVERRGAQERAPAAWRSSPDKRPERATSTPARELGSRLLACFGGWRRTGSSACRRTRAPCPRPLWC